MITINYYRCLIISQNILFSLTNHQNASFSHSFFNTYKYSMNIIIIFKILNLINCVPDIGKVIWLEEWCFQLEYFTYLWKEKRKKITIIRYKNKLKMQKKKKKKLTSLKNINDFTLIKVIEPAYIRCRGM